MEISSALGKIWLITRPAGISGKIRFDKDGSRRGWVFSHLIIRSSKDEWTARKVREIPFLLGANTALVWLSSLVPAPYAMAALDLPPKRLSGMNRSAVGRRSQRWREPAVGAVAMAAAMLSGRPAT